jgi:hypothetical protein
MKPFQRMFVIKTYLFTIFDYIDSHCFRDDDASVFHAVAFYLFKLMCLVLRKSRFVALKLLASLLRQSMYQIVAGKLETLIRIVPSPTTIIIMAIVQNF